MSIAIRFHTTGGPEVLQAEEVTVGDPGPGQAKLRHTAVGLNFIDTYHRNGQYPQKLPSGLGMEAAGVVLAAGPGVVGVKVGDRVVYGKYTGSQVELDDEEIILIKETDVIAKLS